MTRREAREQAFMFVFEKIFNPDMSFDEMKELAEECGISTPDEFTDDILNAVADHTEECDGLIEANLKKWKLSRLPKVSLAVLRIAVAEIMYFDSVPDPVVANEAVELIKKYGAAEDASFVNGLLGSVIRNKNNNDNTGD